MSATNYDSRTADKFVVRLPDGLRADIEAAAHTTDRSMNSVFVQAVRQYLDGQKRQQILLDVLASTVTTPMPTESMHIDDRVRMTANAKRYEWLRDIGFTANKQILVRDHFGNLLTKNDLDREIDRAKMAFGSMSESSTCAD
ncbi:CopG family ribbon-helix-helix protein [Pseudomonas sp. LF242]